MSQHARDGHKTPVTDRPSGPNALDPQQLLDDYKAVADDLGRIPSRREYNEHGTHSASTLENHHGGMRAAREQAGFPDVPSHATRSIRELLYQLSDDTTGGDD